MKIRGLIPLLLTPFVLSAPAPAQTTHVVELNEANEFVPDELTIEVGDTVLWDWVGGSPHNVVSGEGPPVSPGDGALFDSGEPTSDTSTTFEHTFITTGTFPYYCAPHYDVGMRGTITVVEPAGEGSGEVPDDALCEDFPIIRVEFANVSDVFNTDDVDADGVPDAFAVELAEYGACNDAESRTSLVTATRTAYRLNLMAIDDAIAAEDGEKQLILAQYRHVLAALGVISAETRMAIASIADELDADDLVSVTCDGGVCMPQASGGATLREAYREFTKAANEPYAGDGDYDGDGVTNEDEFEAVNAAGGGLNEFIAAATTPTAKEGAGEGEGDTEGNGDEPGGCSATVLPPLSWPSLSVALILGAVVIALVRFGRVSRPGTPMVRSK